MNSKIGNNSPPDCYGKLEKVFPKKPKKTDGLRCTPEACFSCDYRIDCLGDAVKSQNSYLRLKEEIIDRSYDAGNIGFFKRWSQKKLLHSKKQA